MHHPKEVNHFKYIVKLKSLSIATHCVDIDVAI